MAKRRTISAALITISCSTISCGRCGTERPKASRGWRWPWLLGSAGLARSGATSSPCGTGRQPLGWEGPDAAVGEGLHRKGRLRCATGQGQQEHQAERSSSFGRRGGTASLAGAPPCRNPQGRHHGQRHGRLVNTDFRPQDAAAVAQREGTRGRRHGVSARPPRAPPGHDGQACHRTPCSIRVASG